MMATLTINSAGATGPAGAGNGPPTAVAARVATLLGVILPLLGMVAAVVFLWGWGITWVELTLLASMYLLTVLGVTVGFHRLFTHRAFRANTVVQFVLGILGSMAVQGPLLKWAATHRRHHQFSDHNGDPHSPHHYGRGVVGVLRGFWHAHLGWFFVPDPPNLLQYVKDLRQSRLVRAVSGMFSLWVALGLLIPTFIGFLLIGGWIGAVLGLLWGGLVRIFLVHHVTWSVNSLCHLWGRQVFAGKDESRNNWVCGILALGEGWHNNHHAFPTSARHGLRWWQVDVSYWVIRVLAILGLVWDVRTPVRAQGQKAFSK